MFTVCPSDAFCGCMVALVVESMFWVFYILGLSLSWAALRRLPSPTTKAVFVRKKLPIHQVLDALAALEGLLGSQGCSLCSNPRRLPHGAGARASSAAGRRGRMRPHGVCDSRSVPERPFRLPCSTDTLARPADRCLAVLVVLVAGEFVRRGCSVTLYDHTEYTRTRAFQTLRASLWDHVC